MGEGGGGGEAPSRVLDGSCIRDLPGELGEEPLLHQLICGSLVFDHILFVSLHELCVPVHDLLLSQACGRLHSTPDSACKACKGAAGLAELSGHLNGLKAARNSYRLSIPRKHGARR